MNSDIWLTEQTEDYMRKGFRVTEVLFSGKSEFQAVDVVNTAFHGKMLFNDGLAMVSEKDEFVYHDMIAHVPLFTHPNPKNVLVIGGGDGGTAREVLRHKNVEKCVMVEIDKMVVDACLEHIPQTSNIMKGEDSRFELIIGDGLKYAKESKEKFDVILIDSTDPIGPATPLFGPEFYKDLNNLLNDDGIIVSQGESPWHNVDVQQGLMKILNEQFAVSLIYTFNNLTYPDGLWCFTYASKGLHPVKDFDSDRVKNSGIDFKYYNEDIHTAAFTLPTFIKKNLDGLLKG